MINREGTNRKDSILRKVKLLVGTILLTIIIVSSINVAFANQDISSILTNWFEKNRNESIASIEIAIANEKEIQMQRLKEELRVEIDSAKEQLNDFVHEEKERRVLEIKKYADLLISNVVINNEEEKASIIQEYELILQDAINRMDNVQTSESSEEEVENSKEELDHSLDAQEDNVEEDGVK